MGDELAVFANPCSYYLHFTLQKGCERLAPVSTVANTVASALGKHHSFPWTY